MRDDYQIPNFGAGPKEYGDGSFVNRLVRSIEMLFETMRSPGPAEFTDVTADTLDVSGDVTMEGNANVTGNLSITGTSTLTGNVSIGGTLGVTGASTLTTVTTGNILPAANNTYNVGSATLRWATIFTSDLSLNNGIGDWTIVEGKDDLFITNNRTGKKYKFVLSEVS